MDSQLSKLQRALEEAMMNLSAEELSWHPEGKWCVEQVLEHLYLSYTGTIRGFERVLEAGKPLATSAATLKQRARILVVVGLGYMPNGQRAPKVAEPRGLPGATVRAEIGAKIVEMDEVIGRCERELEAKGLGGRAVLDHPILGPLNISQWRKLHLVHGLHHVKQIRRLRAACKNVSRD